MSQVSLNNVVTEFEEKTTFLDLPTEIIVDIFKYLDIPSRFKIRINKRLNQIQCSIHNRIRQITIATAIDNMMRVRVIAHQMDKTIVLSRTIEDFSNKAEPLLHALAKNSHVDYIYIGLDSIRREVKSHIINFFAKFKVDLLTLNCYFDFGINGKEPIFPHIVILAGNAKYMNIDHKCNITAKDLCLLRNMILEGSCRLESIKMFVVYEISLVNACFGLTVHCIESQSKLMYRAMDESREINSIYRINNNHGTSLLHYENGLWTGVHGFDFVEFTKTKPMYFEDYLTEQYKLKLNHEYPM